MSTNSQTTGLIDLFWETIPPVWHRTRAFIRRTAAEKFNLSVEQFQVLRRIRRGIASVSAIAEDGRISRSAVSKAVDMLVNRGMISRHEDLNDRRNIPLRLTARGEQAMAEIFADTETWLEEQLSILSLEEQRIVQIALALIQKSFIESRS